MGWGMRGVVAVRLEFLLWWGLPLMEVRGRSEKGAWARMRGAMSLTKAAARMGTLCRGGA